jgi:tetratricopeptide (TPR) repeat protein
MPARWGSRGVAVPARSRLEEPDMAAESLIHQLLDEISDSGRTPEEVCGAWPELLTEVRRRWQQMCAVKAEVDALFPVSGHGPIAETSPSLQAGADLPRIPGYDVEALLSRGGMGVVYKARHRSLNRPVALKMLIAGAYAGPPERARFQREAEAVASLRHANIVAVHDVGDHEGCPYFTMELLERGSLAQALAGTPQPARQASALLITLAEAVQVAHRAGIVHRDLKPANILLTAEGTPKVADFGLARHFEGEAALTLSGTRMGTPSYMAPEQVVGKAGMIGPATDIYALGALLYEMLTGRPPFRGETAAETERQVIHEEPVSPSRLNTKVPRDLETICLKCLSKEARCRYANVAALADDLRRFGEGRPIAARPVARPERVLRWMRRNPTATALIVTAALLLGLATAAGLREWGLAMRRRAELKQWSERLSMVTNLQEEGRFDEARGILQQPDAGIADLRKRIEQALANLDLVERLDVIRLSRGWNTQGDAIDYAGSSRRYAVAFRERGLGDLPDHPDRVAARLKASPINKALVAALDDWAACADKDVRDWVLRVVRRMDPDPWRDRVRDPDTWAEVKSFPELADMASVEDQPVTLMVAFGTRWRRLGGDPTAFLERVQRTHPDDFWVNYELGHLLGERDPAAAIGYCRAAQALRPNAALVQTKIGNEFLQLGHLDVAIHHLKRSIQIDPNQGSAWSDLGMALLNKGRTDEAADCLHKSVALTPNNAGSLNLLREIRLRQGRREEARAAWHRFIDRHAKVHRDWHGYAELCLFLGDVAGYERGCLELLTRFESSTDPHLCERIGRTCLLLPESPQQIERAAALIDRALAADKSQYAAWAAPYFLFAKGLAEFRRNNLRNSIAILEGEASQVLGPAPRIVRSMALYRRGDREEARQTLALAIIDHDWRAASALELEIWMYHVLRREAEAMIFPNLPAFVAETYQPADQCERLAFVGAAEFNGLTRASARLYADAFATEPSLANDPERGRRYRAACMAASAGCGRGKDASNLDDEERARLRAQARQWLRAEVAAWGKKIDSAPAARESTEEALKLWLTDPDLAGLREPDLLDKLPVAEVRACREMWHEISAQIERTRRRN